MPSLPKAYKSFVRPNLHYGDISKCSIFLKFEMGN